MKRIFSIFSNWDRVFRDATGVGARVCLVGAFSLMFCSPSSATTDTNLTIVHVGNQGNLGFVIFTVNPSAGCAWNNIYFDITSDAGKAYLSILISAYLSGKPVARVDYTLGSDGTCMASLFEM